MPEPSLTPNAPKFLKTLTLFLVCVLVFEVAMIALVPRLHSGSVLKLSLSTLEMRTGNDSSYYMAQGDMAARQTPDALYETVFFQRGIRFIYPPTALLVYRAWLVAGHIGINPFLAMNVTLFLALWATFGVAGQFLLVLAEGQAGYPWAKRERWLLRALVAAMGLTFLPLVNAYCLGQMQTLLTLALVVSIFLWLRGERVTPGLLIGLTCLIKPQMALFLVWGALRRQWGFTCSLAAMLLAGGLVSITVFGWHNNVEYLTVLRYLSRHGDALATNQSLNGLLHRILHVGYFNTAAYGYPPFNPEIYWLTMCFSVLLVVTALAVPYLRDFPGDTLDLLLFAMATTMASPIAWEHHYGVFFIEFLAWMLRSRCSRRVFVPLLVCYLLMTDNWAPVWLLMFSNWTFLLSHVFFGGLLLFIATLLWGKPLLTSEQS